MRCQCNRSDGSFCRNQASYEMRSIFQTSRHARIGTGWFRVYLCRSHFTKTDYSAKTDLRGRNTWKEITRL